MNKEGEPTITFTTDRERYCEPINPVTIGFWYVVILIGVAMITIGVAR